MQQITLRSDLPTQCRSLIVYNCRATDKNEMRACSAGKDFCSDANNFGFGSAFATGEPGRSLEALRNVA